MTELLLAGDLGDFLASAGGKLLVTAIIVLLSVGIVAALYRWVFKYLIDFAVGAFVSFVTLPLVLLIAIVSAVHIIKKEEYEDIFTETAVAGRKGKRVILHSFTVRNDETGELTSFGAFLHKTKLEYLPAFYDLALFRRSIVGVRPLSLTDEKFVNEEDYARFNAPIGLLNPLILRDGKEELTYEDMFAADARYAQKITLWGDLKVVVIAFLNFVRGDKKHAAGETEERSYAQALLERGEITAEDLAEAQAEDEEDADAAETEGADVAE